MPLRYISPNCQFKLKMIQLSKVFSTPFYINVYSQDRNREIHSLPMQKAYLLSQIKRPSATTNPFQGWHLTGRRLEAHSGFPFFPHATSQLHSSLFPFSNRKPRHLCFRYCLVHFAIYSMQWKQTHCQSLEDC